MSQDKDNHIEIFLYPPGETEAVPAGQYRFDPDTSLGTFTYHRDYLSLKNKLPVDPVNLPLANGTKPVSITLGPWAEGRYRLFGTLRDSLPDSWGRGLMAFVHGLPVENPDPEPLMRLSHNQRIGNLDFRARKDQGEKEQIDFSSVDWDKLIFTVAGLERGLYKPLERDSLLYLERTSLGGARPKTLYFDGQDLWLAKLPSIHDVWNEARIELATTALAGNCGLKIPEMKIITAQSGDVLLSKRFDRLPIARGFARLGYFSCQTALDSLRAYKYEQSYLNYADILRTKFPKNWTSELGRDLFKRMCFNVLIRNTDDHALNHGCLFSADGIWPAPVFDLVPDFLPKELIGPFTLSMVCGPAGKKADWNNILAGASHFGLDQKEASVLIQDLALKMSGWRDHYSSYGVSGDDIIKFEGCLDSHIHANALQLGETPEC